MLILKRMLVKYEAIYNKLMILFSDGSRKWIHHREIVSERKRQFRNFHGYSCLKQTVNIWVWSYPQADWHQYGCQFLV